MTAQGLHGLGLAVSKKSPILAGMAMLSDASICGAPHPM
jgi:hypothetical protein